ncbi:MAG: hypothetical protein ACRENG_17370 [bacterium]
MKELDKENSQQQFYFTGKANSPYFPSYWESVASVYDLYGILLVYLIEGFKTFSDQEALKSDWERVGQDIRDVMIRTQDELGEQLKNGNNLTIEEAIIEALDKINSEIELDKVMGKKQNEQTKASAQ